MKKNTFPCYTSVITKSDNGTSFQQFNFAEIEREKIVPFLKNKYAISKYYSALTMESAFFRSLYVGINNKMNKFIDGDISFDTNHTDILFVLNPDKIYKLYNSIEFGEFLAAVKFLNEFTFSFISYLHRETNFFNGYSVNKYDSYMRDFIDKTYTVHSEACKAAYYIKLIRKTVHSSCRSFRRDSRFILRTIEEKRDSLATY